MLFLIAFLFYSAGISAQKDSIKTNDSINTLILRDHNSQVAKMEQQRKLDSIKQADLENQLLTLKQSDGKKKEELQVQLAELKERDEKRIAAKIARIDSLRQTAKGFPVVGFFKDTLFLVYSKLGSFSAHDRAEAISERIKKINKTFDSVKDSINLSESETTIDLLIGEYIIMSISENDAIWNNKSKEELADDYRKLIFAALKKYDSETSIVTLVKEIALAIFVLVIIAALIFYLNRLFKWTANIIIENKGKRINGLKIKNYTLFDAQRSVNALLTLNTLIKWLLILLVVYITLPVLFGIFPWTKNFSTQLFGYILTPAKKIGSGVWNYLPNLITIIVIVFVFRLVLKGLAFLKNEVEKGNLILPGFYPDWANPTYQIIKVVVYAFLMVVIFPYLPGSDSPIFKGVSVFLGVLFTFGSSGSLSNIIAGLVLTYMRLFKIGDRVKIGEVFGDVIEKSLLVTRIRTIKNEIISIPNSTVMASHTINYSSDSVDSGLILHSTVTIGYDVPWKKTHEALLAAADRTNLLLKDPKPFVLQTSLDDFYVSYQINAYTKSPNKQAVIYSELHCHIQDCFFENGIEILSPHYFAARDGNAAAVPPDYLAKDYSAPPFNVKTNSNK